MPEVGQQRHQQSVALDEKEERRRELRRLREQKIRDDPVLLEKRRAYNREYLRRYRADPANAEKRRGYERARQERIRADPVLWEKELARHRDPAFLEKKREYQRRRRADPVLGEKRREWERANYPAKRQRIKDDPARFEKERERHRRRRQRIREDPALLEKERARNRERDRVRNQGEARKAQLRDITRRHEARKRGAVTEPYSREQIAERDGWRCHLCGESVSRETWSVDHLVPISCGGADTKANVRLAHRLCNSRRGARGAAQLLLFGE